MLPPQITTGEKKMFPSRICQKKKEKKGKFCFYLDGNRRNLLRRIKRASTSDSVRWRLIRPVGQHRKMPQKRHLVLFIRKRWRGQTKNVGTRFISYLEQQRRTWLHLCDRGTKAALGPLSSKEWSCRPPLDLSGRYSFVYPFLIFLQIKFEKNKKRWWSGYL